MVNVELNKKSNNPFKGLSNCLKVLQNIEVVHDSSTFNLCWNEVKNNKEHRELFFSLMFSMGDITSRQHNIFKGIKKDSGGSANREGFYKFVEWLFTHHRSQFEKFLKAGLFNEYNCFDTLLRCRIKTTRKGKIVEQYVSLLSNPPYRTMLAEYLYSVINGTNPFNKHLVAKFLTLPRLSKRSGHTKMLPETKKAMEYKTLFLIELSKLMGWDYEVQGTYANFRGYREWRKQYNQELESVLFSSKKIFDFTKDEFISWLDKLPSQARYRVRNRVLYKEQYPNQKRWFEEWEKFKEKKQEEERILTEKVRQGTASTEDKEKLEKVKKEAKVNVGAVNFKTIYEEICRGTVDALRLESFMNRVNLPYNSLVIIDDSGSMNGAPFNFATFIASVCLCKNPDDEARNLLGFFSNSTIFKSYIDSRSTQQNSLLRRTISQTIHEPLVDPTKSFLDNYRRIDSFCKAVFRSGGTHINTIAQAFANNSEVIDALKNYPVWTIISDGDYNNSYNAKESIKQLFEACEKHLGFKPFIVAIDIPNGWTSIRERDWSDVDNFIYIPANIVQIEQFLTNFKDMNTFDVYTPLQSLWRSNRYELVRVNTL